MNDPKICLEQPAFLYPMPMTVVGAEVDGRPNYLAVAWVTPVNFDPPMIGIALGKEHYTSRGIHEYREFSINLPTLEQLAVTDYTGLTSGAKVDKSRLFTRFAGRLAHAPLIAECPLCLECKVARLVELPTNDFIIGRVIAAWSEARYLTDGIPDIAKMRPFTLTMPDNRYWEVGSCVGHAWSSGRDFS